MAGVHPVLTGLACRCPACGQGKLFDGFLRVAPVCASCGQDLSSADSGDGPVVFVILIVGGIVCFAALWSIFTVDWPLWVHLVLWLSLATVLSLVAMRLFKSVLVALQFHFKAGEARRG